MEVCEELREQMDALGSRSRDLEASILCTTNQIIESALDAKLDSLKRRREQTAASMSRASGRSLPLSKVW